ncbi:MAG: hypothetical protein JW709_07285 [Sedimentisphaerales bacterium]|nr:hypothetical protein [Sedimentisphaerales bacterium]
MKNPVIWPIFIVFFATFGCSGGKNEANNQPFPSSEPSAPSSETIPPSTPTTGESTPPPPSSEGWSDIAGRIAGGVFLSAEKGVVFYGFDALAHPNEPVELTCRLQKSKNLRDLEGVTLAYYVNEELLGTAQTDDEGVALLSWQPPGIGDYSVLARIVDSGKYDKELLQVSDASLFIRIRSPEARFVVIDLDHTLVDSSFLRVLAGGGTPMIGSRDVTARIAAGYDIIYLTHRPDLMTRTSKGWLQRYGYPPGPVLVSTLREALGDSGTYKTARLASVQEMFPHIQIGIGDKISDAVAYVKNGMEAYLIPHYDTDEADDTRDMADAINELSKYEKLQVVNSWSQIERGIFEGKRYPPETFVRELRRRAEKLKHEDKEEDDD